METQSEEGRPAERRRRVDWQTVIQGAAAAAAIATAIISAMKGCGPA
jgi:hypothetical protein